MKRLYFDCTSGISGDMTVASLIDVGVPYDYLKEQLNLLPINKEFDISIKEIQKNGIRSKKFDVHINSHTSHFHRTFDEIKIIINSAGYSENITQNAIKMFSMLAIAEAEVHNIPVDKVHFHEVGAIDSIVDICAVAICMDYIKVDDVYVSEINVGGGLVKCEHGYLQVPAPATEILLRNVKLFSSGNIGELVTPTGASILKNYVTKYEKSISGKIINSGYGAGTKDFESIPNILRVSILDAENNSIEEKDEIIQIDFQIDDMTGEEIGYFIELLEKSKTKDFIFFPVNMKKKRIGTCFQIIIEKQDFQEIEELIFKNTSTIGFRVQKIERVTLKREMIDMQYDNFHIRKKNSYYNDELVNEKIEYEDIINLARTKNIPLKDAKKLLNY